MIDMNHNLFYFRRKRGYWYRKR